MAAITKREKKTENFLYESLEIFGLVKMILVISTYYSVGSFLNNSPKNTLN